MPTPIRSTALLLAALAAAPATVKAQDPPTPPTPPAEQAPAPPAKPPFVVRRYPEDRDATIAEVGGRQLTLGNLVDHLDEKHYPGFRAALGARPEIQRMLQSDLIAPWVRHFADIEAMRQSLGEQPIDEAKLLASQSEALRKQFQAWLDSYIEDRRNHNRPTELSQKQVDSLLADFQLRQGLSAELQGWLDYLEPGDYSRAQLQQFYTDNARAFGGRVTMAHILVQHREGGTGILLAEEGFARATAKLADIKARLRPDGTNFEEVARAQSDDTRTAPSGGILNGVHRFDDRLPAALCRAVWFLRDGEVSDVVETQYGWHLVKRIEFNQNMFILFTDDAIPGIREAMRRSRQEDRVFAARAAAKLRLLL